MIKDMNCAFVSCDPSNRAFEYGIALSGGGSVAFSGCIGLFRALEMLQPDNQMCVSCVSGSSWLCSQLFFTRLSISDLLGNYLPPEQCTLDALESTTPSFVGNCVANSNLLKTIENLYGSVPDNELWIAAISDIFLQPYHLENTVVNDFYKIPYLQKPYNVHCTRPKFPFLIINSTLVQPEYTINGIVNIDFTTTLSGLVQEISNNPPVGGVTIQNFSFGCLAPETCSSNKYKRVQMPNSNRYFTLASMTGISSSTFVTDVQKISTVIPKTASLIPVLNLWSPSALQDVDCQVGDGGLNDAAGVLALLSRSVKKVFLFYTRTNGFEGSPFVIPTLQKLFGVYSDSYDNSIQVFPSHQYSFIEEQLMSSYTKGLPTFAYMENLLVLPNPLNNIKGGYVICFAVMVTNPCSQYQSLLPLQTQSAIQTPMFPFFPNYPIVFANGENMIELTVSQINLLANYVQWCVMRVLPNILM